MSLRPPRRSNPSFAIQTGFDELAVEILAEKANALERAGLKAEKALAQLSALPRDDPARPPFVKAAADALHGYFIQRELMGFRGHGEVVERLGVPREVLARVGAR